ncbi:hypothetical protein CDAR_81721 [Caerostris darwini]|uniref:Uncharacterized protein n=1 Tax=Caerostris darwini TaxID=1538125 RepID=A0AAV4WJY9_9ARAC|nr:hypothetical protein CDAR_81721 [Caerostris darwini]
MVHFEINKSFFHFESHIGVVDNSSSLSMNPRSEIIIKMLRLGVLNPSLFSFRPPKKDVSVPNLPQVESVVLYSQLISFAPTAIHVSA